MRNHYLITLKDTHTGEVKVIEDDYAEDITEWDVVFNWEENNYSCDCNRGAFFYDEDFPCGDGRFELIKIEAKP